MQTSAKHWEQLSNLELSGFRKRGGWKLSRPTSQTLSPLSPPSHYTAKYIWKPIWQCQSHTIKLFFFSCSVKQGCCLKLFPQYANIYIIYPSAKVLHESVRKAAASGWLTSAHSRACLFSTLGEASRAHNKTVHASLGSTKNFLPLWNMSSNKSFV